MKAARAITLALALLAMASPAWSASFSGTVRTAGAGNPRLVKRDRSWRVVMAVSGQLHPGRGQLL